MMTDPVNNPAPNPCTSCPYRRDVPSGIWAESEYRKLADYDADTPFQPQAVFLCHQTGADDPRKRLCAGWAAAHDMDNNLALRFAARHGDITPNQYQQICAYTTDSGAQASAHGMAALAHPNRDAINTMAKIARKRADLKDPGDHT